MEVGNPDPLGIRQWGTLEVGGYGAGVRFVHHEVLRELSLFHPGSPLLSLLN